MSRTLRSISPTLPYATAIRRLNLSGLSDSLNDYLVSGLEMCSRLDRITLTNAEGVSTQAIKRIMAGMKETTAVDLSGTPSVENTVVRTVGEAMDKLQGLNLTGCKGVGDDGLKIIAEKKNFRRVSATSNTPVRADGLAESGKLSPNHRRFDCPYYPRLPLDHRVRPVDRPSDHQRIAILYLPTFVACPRAQNRREHGCERSRHTQSRGHAGRRG